MKKFFRITFVLLLVAIVGNVSAQETKQTDDSYIKDNITLNIGTAIFQKYGLEHYMASVDVLYGLNNWFEAGLFTIGRGYYVDYGNISKEYDLCLYYGVAAKAHLLPIIINPSYRRFDVYANLQLGAKSVISHLMSNRTSLFVNGGLGVGYNFSKRIGLFYECNYGNSDGMNGGISGGLNHKFGLKLRF